MNLTTGTGLQYLANPESKNNRTVMANSFNSGRSKG